MFLKAFLSNGVRLSDDANEAARANDISEKTLRRAREQLHVVTGRDGFQGKVTWQLPD